MSAIFWDGRGGEKKTILKHIRKRTSETEEFDYFFFVFSSMSTNSESIPSSQREWISFPVSFKDLPLDTLVGVTLWTSSESGKDIPIGGGTISVFEKETYDYCHFSF